MEKHIQIFVFIEVISLGLFVVFLFGGMKARENIVNYLKDRFNSEYEKHFSIVNFRKRILSDYETVKILFNNEKYIFSNKINLDDKLINYRRKYIFQACLVLFSLFVFLTSPFVLMAIQFH